MSFIPQSGYTYSATAIGDGQLFTITKTGGGFGTKPVGAKPLLWIDPATTGNLDPSPLGRSTATYIGGKTTINYVSTGGPTGGGWGQGIPVVASDYNTQKPWAMAVDVDQWGAGSPAINDFGSKYYMWRTMYRNFAHYDESGPIYNQTYNIKNWRVWARNPDTLNSPEARPDFYMSVSNERPTTEIGSGPYPITPTPDWTRTGQSPGTPEYIANNNCIQFDGGLPGNENSVTFKKWFSEEIVWRSNLNDPGAHPPLPDNTSVIWDWYVEGLASNNPAFTLPAFNYQWNQYYLNAPSVGGTGRTMRWYFWHYIIEGEGRNMIPIGSFVGYGPTLVDDSWCRVHMRNGGASGSRSAFTVTEYQPITEWSDNSVTVSLRQGRLGGYDGNALIITDNNGVEHFAGTFQGNEGSGGGTTTTGASGVLAPPLLWQHLPPFKDQL